MFHQHKSVYRALFIHVLLQGLQTGDPLADNQLQSVMQYAHWKFLRSKMSPAFSSGKLKKVIDLITIMTQRVLLPLSLITQLQIFLLS